MEPGVNAQEPPPPPGSLSGAALTSRSSSSQAEFGKTTSLRHFNFDIYIFKKCLNCELCNCHHYYKLQDKSDLTFEGNEWKTAPSI